ncbi:MAG: HNH endonuclease [Anaeromyxobacter sp.]|nr:HNH endonuclease [Anaeromyxobacter sp.]
MVAHSLRLVLPSDAHAPEALAAPTFLVACEASAAWLAARPPQPLPPATLTDARALRDALAGLLSRERAAAADFLLALADFDQRRGWEVLGHSSLFTFLTRELHLSKGAAFLRFTAARLLPRFPAVEAPLRDGRLCLSTMGELARLLTLENQAELLPRFFGLSAREAKEVAAAISPLQDPPRREVVKIIPTQQPVASSGSSGSPAGGGLVRTSELLLAAAAPQPIPLLSAEQAAAPARGELVRTSELALSVTLPHPLPSGSMDWSGDPARVDLVRTSEPPRASVRPQPDEVEPLTADLRRLHLTVSRRLLEKVAAAKDGLAHALPGATTAQVLEAALDLLLEKQARRRALPAGARAGAQVASSVVQPSSAGNPTVPAGSASAPSDDDAMGSGAARSAAHPRSSVHHEAEGHANSADTASPKAPPNSPAAAAPAPHPRFIPAAVRREVWQRDGQRCQFPLDLGGTCGATHRLELDHLVPLALGGQATAANLRVVCARHNRYAARLALGPAAAAERGRQRARTEGPTCVGAERALISSTGRSRSDSTDDPSPRGGLSAAAGDPDWTHAE